MGASCEQFNQMYAELTGLPDGTDPDTCDVTFGTAQVCTEAGVTLKL